MASVIRCPSVSCARIGYKSHPNGGHGKNRPSMRKVPQAFFGSRRDQKKFVRSMVVPHRVFGGCEARMRPMLESEGNEKEGFGFGDRVFIPRRSAMKAAFSVVFGRRNALRLSCVG